MHITYTVIIIKVIYRVSTLRNGIQESYVFPPKVVPGYTFYKWQVNEFLVFGRQVNYFALFRRQQIKALEKMQKFLKIHY